MRPGRRARAALLLAVSWLAHLKGLTAPPLDYHYHRQVNTAAIARNYHRNGLHILSPQIDWNGADRGRAATELPLYMWLVGLLWPLGGLGEIWGRLLSALLSSLTAVALWLFLERELEPDAAFYAGILFSLLPLEVYFGRTIQPEAMALLASVASLYFWRRWLERPRWPAWAAAVLLAFLAIGHKLPYAFILLPLGYMAWERLGPAALRRPAVWLAPAAAGLGVLAWYRYASSGAYVVPSHPGEFLHVLEYGRLPFYVQFQILSRFPELATTYGGLALLLVGARDLIARRRHALLSVWFGSVWVTLVAGGAYSFHHEYTSLPLEPVCAAFMGAGVSVLLARARRLARPARGWALAGLALLVLSVPVHAALRIKHWYGQNFPFLASAKAAADSVSGPDDLFLCNQRAPSVYLYYLDRRGWSWDLQEAGPAELGRIDERIRDGARFYATAKAGLFEDRSNPLTRAVADRFPVVYDDGGLLIFSLSPVRPRGSRGARRG